MQGRQLERPEAYCQIFKVCLLPKVSNGKDRLRKSDIVMIIWWKKATETFFCEGDLEHFRKNVHFRSHGLSNFKIETLGDYIGNSLSPSMLLLHFFHSKSLKVLHNINEEGCNDRNCRGKNHNPLTYVHVIMKWALFPYF